MAPYISFPSKASLKLSDLDERRRRGIAFQTFQSAELCGGAACEISSGDTGDATLDKAFTQTMPLAATAHVAQPVPSSLKPASSGTSGQSANVHLNSSAVVCMTLAFISVLLGLGAMAVTRTRWYRRKKEAWDKVSWRRQKGQAETQINVETPPPPPWEESSSESTLEDEKMVLDLASEKTAVDRYSSEEQYVIGGDEEETEASQDSCSSVETTMMEEICTASSSRTSIESMEEEFEEEAERVQVHRAHTQSVEIKRAVLISLPPK